MSETKVAIVTGSATGVGAATRRCVVVCFLLCLIFGYSITWLFYQVLKDVF